MSIKNSILFVGIGQCGSQISKELETLGYNTFYINTSAIDFPEDIEDDKKYLISGAKGCSRDRQKAKEYALGSFGDINDTIESRYPLVTNIFIVFSAGGGSGSGISPLLLDIMASKNSHKKYGAVMVLPHSSESILSQNNAKECLKQLTDIKDSLYSIHLLDNDKRDNFLDINSEFAMLFDSIADFSSTAEMGNIDDDELEKLLTVQGFTTILDFKNDNFNIEFNKEIHESIYAEWEVGCEYIGIILNNKQDKIEALEQIESKFGIPITDYTSFTSDSNKVIATGMKLNREISRGLTSNIKNKLAKKQELESKNDSEDEDEDIDLLSNINIKKPTKKKPIGKNNDKDLDAILNKWRNM